MKRTQRVAHAFLATVMGVGSAAMAQQANQNIPPQSPTPQSAPIHQATDLASVHQKPAVPAQPPGVHSASQFPSSAFLEQQAVQALDAAMGDMVRTLSTTDPADWAVDGTGSVNGASQALCDVVRVTGCLEPEVPLVIDKDLESELDTLSPDEFAKRMKENDAAISKWSQSRAERLAETISDASRSELHANQVSDHVSVNHTKKIIEVVQTMEYRRAEVALNLAANKSYNFGQGTVQQIVEETNKQAEAVKAQIEAASGQSTYPQLSAFQDATNVALGDAAKEFGQTLESISASAATPGEIKLVEFAVGRLAKRLDIPTSAWLAPNETRTPEIAMKTLAAEGALFVEQIHALDHAQYAGQKDKQNVSTTLIQRTVDDVEMLETATQTLNSVRTAQLKPSSP